jgi:hypothetical protein
MPAAPVAVMGCFHANVSRGLEPGPRHRDITPP